MSMRRASEELTDLKVLMDFVLQDDLDGKGPHIVKWPAGVRKPTAAQIAAKQAEIEARPDVKPMDAVAEIAALKDRLAKAGL